MAMEEGLLWKCATMLVQDGGEERSKMAQVRYIRYWLEGRKSGKIAGGWIMRHFLVRDSLNSHKNCERLKTTEIYSLTLLQGRCPRSKQWLKQAPSKGSMGESSLASCSFWWL